MFTPHQFQNILFLDIETASFVPNYDALPERFKPLWDKRAERIDANKSPAEVFERAGIYAEFARVVCISCGYVQFDEHGAPSMKLKSFSDMDENVLLREFATMLNRWTDKTDRMLCAHNGKEFDYPFLGRRYMVNGLDIPHALAVQGRKPWELAHLLDTMELWKFGDYKSYTSLDLLCALFDVPTPKDDMDGSKVGKAFWEEKDLARIAHYCEKDVAATAKVLLRMSRLPVWEEV